MRVGLLGVGRIGVSHADVVRGHPAVEELVLADADPSRARDVADRLGCRSFEHVADVFSEGLDAVVIATATGAHAELIERGARAGMTVFCEKPIALDIDSTKRVVDVVEDLGTPVQIGFQRRFDAGYRRAREALQDGEVGDLHRVHQVTGDEKPPDPGYLPGSGGFFRDCSIHDFDILRWVTGREVSEVVAFGANRGADFFRDADDVDNAVGILRLDDDTLVTMQGSRYNGAGHDVRMELAGTRSTYAVGLGDHSPLVSAETDVAFPAGEPWSDFWARFTPAYVAEMNAFLDVAAHGAAIECTVREALAALYVAEAADRSLREGRRVEVVEVAK